MYSSPPPSPPSSSHSHDSPSTDWKQKYYEVSDILTETRAELDDFTRTSRELEEELERDLERTEKAQDELRQRVAKVEGERDEWKAKFMSLQHNHNTTVNSLQRELDATRQSVHLYKAQVRELEMGNDDLERNERQATSSLVDVEQKYAKALEDKILLEHELQDKLVLEETCQRLRDELRDATVEVTVLKDQLEQTKALPLRPAFNERQTSSNSTLPLVSPTGSEHESLMRTAAPDLSLADLMPSSSQSSINRISMQSRLSQEIFEDEFGTLSSSARASPTSFVSAKSHITAGRSTVGTTASNTPTQKSVLDRALSPTANTRLPTPRRRPVVPSPSPVPSPPARGIPVSSSRPGLQPKSKGVQMVSEMRARVRTLEQRIHANMPRIRSQNNLAGQTGLPALKLGRPPSRPGTANSASTAVNSANLRTPRKATAGAKDPASPWVMIADEGDADMTMRISPEKAPKLPIIPAVSPMVGGPRGLSESHSTPPTSGIRPPSRSHLPTRSTSALGRPLDRSVSAQQPRNKSPTHPPTAFPGGAKNPRASSAGSTAPADRFKIPASRTVGFAGNGMVDPDSPTNNVYRPTTPTKNSTNGLRRNHTISSPTRPPTTGIFAPRQRTETLHSSRTTGSVNTAHAGTTPGRAKARSVTGPETPPPPVPSLPAHAHATSRNAVLGMSRIGAPKTRSAGWNTNQRIVKDAFGDAGLLVDGEEDTVRRARAGTML